MSPYDGGGVYEVTAQVSVGEGADTADLTVALSKVKGRRPPTRISSPDNEMTSSEIYATLSPSVAYIETPSGYASGFLIEGDYVVTNLHVVWPFEEVRVAIPDGTESVAPVAAWDPMSALAVLGPVDAAAPPVELRVTENLAIGSELSVGLSWR